MIYHPLTAAPFKRNRSYTELLPCRELYPYIRCYWGTEPSFLQRDNDSAPEIVIPDTCVDIIYYIDDSDHKVFGGFCGINDHSFQLPAGRDIEHTVTTFAIRFYAWSAYAFAECLLLERLSDVRENKVVENVVHKYGYADQSHLLREFKRYHSMDVYKARAFAFQDVENIQDVSDG